MLTLPSFKGPWSRGSQKLQCRACLGMEQGHGTPGCNVVGWFYFQVQIRESITKKIGLLTERASVSFC